MLKTKKFSPLFKSLLSLFLAAALFVGVAVIPDTEIFTAYADKVDDLKEKKKDIQKKISENEKKLKELKESISEQKDVLDSLNVIIEDYESKISVLNTSIDTHNKEIDKLNIRISEINGEIARIDEQINDINNSISQKEADIESTLDLLKERMRSNYIAGGISDIEILIGSTDFTSFLTRLEILDRAAQYDNKLIGEFEEDIDALDVLIEECEQSKVKKNEKKSEVEAKKLDIQASKDAVQADIDELDSSKSEVEAKYAEAVKIARNLDKESDTYKNTIRLLERDEDRVAEEIASFLRQNGSSSSEEKKYYYTGDSKWAFPLAVRSYYVSSNYGWRSFGGGEFHKGIDICSRASDKTVVATRGGKVIQQGYHYSMGNYVMIDHGDGYTSIYMHFRDSAYVHTGETVKQGQAIGYMGTTGNSTGVHLHFQINKDGSHVNPNNYINF